MSWVYFGSVAFDACHVEKIDVGASHRPAGARFVMLRLDTGHSVRIRVKDWEEVHDLQCRIHDARPEGPKVPVVGRRRHPKGPFPIDPTASVTLDEQMFRALVQQGQELRKAFDRATVSMRILNADDWKRTSR